MTQWIVIIGNPLDGFRHYGPFPSQDEAIKWAEANTKEEWWGCSLMEP